MNKSEEKKPRRGRPAKPPGFYAKGKGIFQKETGRLSRHLAERLRELRINWGLSQQQVADKCGGSVRVGTVHSYESGHQIPRLSHILIFCAMFGVRLEHFLPLDVLLAIEQNDVVRLVTKLESGD